jgi:hypothetical protein
MRTGVWLTCTANFEGEGTPYLARGCRKVHIFWRIKSKLFLFFDISNENVDWRNNNNDFAVGT